MGRLIGWSKSVCSVAQRIMTELRSSTPYFTFSIQGERRSGRSTFFAALSEQLSADIQDTACFVGEPTDAARGPFASALVAAIAASKQVAGDYSRFSADASSSAGFFELAAEIRSREGRTPVFLLDLGPALEAARPDKVLQLARYLKEIVDFKSDRNTPFALGVGWTTNFAITTGAAIAGDVYRDRYPALRYLGTTYDDEHPFSAFRDIVQQVASASVPERFTGLLRVPDITAGKYGENLVFNGVAGEASAADVWRCLQGQWQLLPALQAGTLSFSDLAELLLANRGLERNICPEWLTPSGEGSFLASDALYSMFSLPSPQRDPTALERLRNRLADQADEGLVDEILGALKGWLETACGARELLITHGGGRTGVLRATLEEMPSADADAPAAGQLDTEIDGGAFPHSLVIGLYLDAPEAEAFQAELTEAMEAGHFVLVLFPEPAEGIERTPLGRRAPGAYSGVRLQTDQLVSLLSSGPLDAHDAMMRGLVAPCVAQHLRRRPCLPLFHEACRRTMTAIIASGGFLEAAKLSGELDLPASAAAVVSRRMVAAGLLKSARGTFSWDPAADPVMVALLDSGGDADAAFTKLAAEFTLPASPEWRALLPDLLAVYAGVFPRLDERDLSDLTSEDVVRWHALHRGSLLEQLGEALGTEPELGQEFAEQMRLLSESEVADWQDIADDRRTLLELLGEIRRSAERIQRGRKEQAQTLADTKTAFLERLHALGGLLTEAEQRQIEGEIRGLASAPSERSTAIQNRLAEHEGQRDDLVQRLSDARKRCDGLRPGPGAAVVEAQREVEAALATAEAAQGLSLAQAEEALAELERRLEVWERQALKRRIFSVGPGVGQVGRERPAPGGDRKGPLTEPRPESPEPGEGDQPVRPRLRPETGPVAPPPPPPPRPQDEDAPLAEHPVSVTEPDWVREGAGVAHGVPVGEEAGVPRDGPARESERRGAAEVQTFSLADADQVKALLRLMTDPGVEVVRIHLRLEQE